ncbi:bifunctional folylpolyglutamate synthase/dihydrofolate synthase [bacterium]|nr:bifunctional folylpolyglutamate synthase/dihydrofolate synthase [bacterium]
MSNYQEAIDLLTSQGKFYINLGLDRITAILDILASPQDKLKCIHVAGTNGKGSVCSIISTILTEAGYKTGLFTSPHLFRYTERIKINNKEIDENVFAQKIFKINKLAEENNIHLTEFEILTAVMFEYFAENNVDYAVIEVGLGGKYDSTNIIKNPLCSIITSIDFDHTERLGKTIEEIAEQKCGIIKPDCPVITSKTNKGFDVIKAKSSNNQLIVAENFENYELNLKGSYQKENLNLALTAIKTTLHNIDETTIKKALKHVVHHGRFEYFEDKKVLIDGAHNPNGIKALRENLDIYFKNQNLRFIFGCLRNKDYPQMINLLFKDGDEIYFNHFNHGNSATYEELSSVCKYSSKEYKGKLPIFDGITVICGSLYMINEVLKDFNINYL